MKIWNYAVERVPMERSDFPSGFGLTDPTKILKPLQNSLKSLQMIEIIAENVEIVWK